MGQISGEVCPFFSRVANLVGVRGRFVREGSELLL
jgi:hypothetical protein